MSNDTAAAKSAEAKAKDTPEQAEFRAYCRNWLAANHPGEPPVELPHGALELSDPAALDWLQAWQKSAYDAGLVGCDYPAEVGGGGLDRLIKVRQQMEKVFGLDS